VYKILKKQALSDVSKLMVVQHPRWRPRPGREFVIVRVDETGERIPLTSPILTATPNRHAHLSRKWAIHQADGS